MKMMSKWLRILLAFGSAAAGVAGAVAIELHFGLRPGNLLIEFPLTGMLAIPTFIILFSGYKAVAKLFS